MRKRRLISVVLQTADASKAYAQGNLFVVFTPKSGHSSEAHPSYQTNLTDLWCQATKDGETRIAILSSRFLQVFPRPVHTHRAHFSNENRAYLHFSERVTPSVIGKYKCEITTVDNEFVTGNLFVYMRPIFQSNSSFTFEQVDDDEPFKLTANSIKITRKETAHLICPAVGYPVPDITWYKDSILIDTTNVTKYRQFANGELFIYSADDLDEGVYKCVAKNSFPLRIDAEDHNYSAELEHHLRVTNPLAWLIPLIIIIFIIILLFLVIYFCAWCKHNKGAQYHVAKKEKCIRKAEEQQLEDEANLEE